MHFTLTDVFQIVGYLGAFISLYIAIRKDQVKSDTIIQQHEEKIKELRATLKEETNKRNLDTKELWNKLVNIENTQSQTNVFLEENLKSINRLLEIHDASIKNIKDRLSINDKDMKEFYKTYELKRKQ